MLSRFSISVLLVIATLVWGSSLLLLGYDLSWDYLKPYSLTVTVLMLSLSGFNKFLWRLWPAKEFSGVPDLKGTWRVELKSTYKDPVTQEPKPPIQGFATIRQSYSLLSIRLMTEEAESFLVAQNIKRYDDGSYDVFGVYQSDPNIHLRGDVSEIHYGSFKYRVVGNPPTEMVGHYWTDRSTKGSIKLFGHEEALYDSYSSARQGMSNSAI